jgi:hypothetical protein
MQKKAAIGSFFDEFSKFETLSIGTALRSLSQDSLSVDHAEELLDFEARLKLLERMAFARDIPSSLMMELEAVFLRARKLHDLREELARNVAAAANDEQESATARQNAGSQPANRKPMKRRKANYAKLEQLANVVPAESTVVDYAAEAVELQDALHAISAKVDTQLRVNDTQA